MSRRRAPFTLAVVFALLLPVTACAQGTPASAEQAYQEGRFEDAARAWAAVVDDNPDDLASRRSLAAALMDVGRYRDAADAAVGVPYMRGEALRAVGELEDAEEAYRAAVEEGGPDRWPAELRLGELAFDRGDVAAAIDRFDRFISLYNGSADLSARELTAVGEAVWYLGRTEPQLFQDAVMAFDEATRIDPGYLEAHVRLAELFVEKYNSPEAQGALEDAQQISNNHPRVMLALARALELDGNRGQALENVRQALEINPNLVPARVFLARMFLDVEDQQSARQELNRALEVNPGSLDALAMLAATHFVADDDAEYRRTVDRFESINPNSATLLTTVAEIAAQQRRYAEAEALAREATERDPQAWDSFAVWGLNQFRLGRIEEARAALEQSFAGDPYNVWIKNNLDLLDTFEEYRVVTLPRFEFMLHGDEADLLLPYLEVAGEQAYSDLTSRYSDTERGRVRVELYPRSADFSVRTVGMAGMGALGVSFGDVVALDSPSAREAGAYNWLTTFWHELAHTVALGISDNRVPRWFTEGLSVWEERRATPNWGHPITPELLVFYDDEELPPVSRLNEGFMRPRSPRHLSGAYDLASLVISWVVEREGFDGVIEFLHGYAAGLSNDQVLERVLGMDPEQVDREFDRWLRSNYSIENARAFGPLLQEGARLARDGDQEAAIRSLRQAAELFPVAQTGSPYAVLAQVHLDRGERAEAIEALRILTRNDETAFSANLELARLLSEEDDAEGAAEALERAVWIYPFDPEPHTRLADAYGELGDWERAARERRALLALRPSNRAEAIYQLALALFNGGDRDAARSEVLRALELAPGYEDAQQLLLRLHEDT